MTRRRRLKLLISARLPAVIRSLALPLVCLTLWATATAADEGRFIAEPCGLMESPCCAAGGNGICAAWADDQWRLLCRDDCYRPKTLFAWSGTERTYVNGTEDEPL